MDGPSPTISDANGGPEPVHLTLADLAARTVPPVPWADGDNIPWDAPAFSERMLDEHLSQGHDLVVRRTNARRVSQGTRRVPWRYPDAICTTHHLQAAARV